MPKKKTTARPPIKSFQKEVEKALKHINDPQWLGTHSLLAAPYFFAEYLREQKIDTTGPLKRGDALQKLLRSTISKLDTQEANLLSLYYLQDWSEKETYTELGISKATFQRNRKKAVSELSLVLSSHLKPALRAEVPRPQMGLLERNKLTTTCLSALKEGKSVGLTGLGGIGKTTVGQHIAVRMTPQPAFWFTFRLGLNDNFSSLIFALGSFLARQGASTLWAELIADKAHLDMNKALGLVRYDLANPTLKRPALCFDEVDLLRPAELEGHATLLAFLESLKGLAPLLFIGQQLPLDIEEHYPLKNLSLNSIQIMLKRAEIKLSTDDMERIERYTKGNPRLLELFIGLHRSDEPIDELLDELRTVPSVEFLLKRMWLRLNKDQQKMLFSLAPFRRTAPRDAWNQTGEQEALSKLIERRLVQEPYSGQLELLPAFRGLLYNWLSADHRKTVHLRAGMIRAERGEYTATAYHYLQAGEEEIAFRLWHDHQEQEINQGQVETALTIFDGISKEQLTKKDQEHFALLKAQLLKITGEYRRSHLSITTMEWETPTLEAQVKRLEGDIAELKGHYDEATEAYRAGLATPEKLLSEKAQFHKDLGWVAKRENKLDQAWREAMLADYEAQNLKGYVQESNGDYDQAKKYYIKALELAKQADYDYGWGKTCNNLAGVMALQGEFEIAQEYWEKAYDSFKRREQISSMASAKVNQAMSLNLARQHQAAIRPAKKALEIFQRLDEPWGRRVARLQLAEAYLGIRDFDNAETAAQEIIEQEEGRGVYDAWWVLGEVQLAKGQTAEAVDSFERVTSYAQQHNLPVLTGYGLRSLGKAYRAIGDNKTAETTFDRAMEWFELRGMQNEAEETRKICDLY